MVSEQIRHLVAVFDVFPTGKLHAVGVFDVLAHLNAKQAIVSDSVVFVSEVTVVGAHSLMPSSLKAGLNAD